jgi:hypothetical protein
VTGLSCGTQYYFTAHAANGYDGVEGTILSFTTSACPVADGDINSDGNVDVADMLLAMRILNGLYIPTPAEQSRWDVAPLVNGVPVPDGQNNLGDYMVLSRKVLGVISY